MQRRVWFVLILMAAFGCTASLDNENTWVPTTTPNVTGNEVQASTTSPSALPMSISESQMQLEISEECIEIESKTQGTIRGSLVFQKEYGSRLVIVDSQTGTQRFIPDDPDMSVRGAYISPDGDWLIYRLDWGEPNGETKLILTRTDGIQQMEIPFGDWSVSSIFWLNNDVLRITEPNNALTQLNNFALDPLLGSSTPLRSDFPDIADNAIDWGIDGNAIQLGVSQGINIIYHPSLTKALYPTKDGQVSLYDLESNQEIARLSPPGRARFPKWSPSGSDIAFINTVTNVSNNEILDEFMLVSQNGSRIRHLSLPSSFSKRLYIENYSWSPDNTQIAFWVKYENNQFTTAQNPVELAILDLTTNAVTTHCISGTNTIEYNTYTDIVNIIWSPDSTALLIVRYNNDNDKSTDEIVVDLSNKLGYRVIENMQPIGWMSKEP